MKKGLYILFALTLSTSLLQAQSAAKTDVDERTYQDHQHTIGLNAIGLIRQFTDTAFNQFDNPYLFTYNIDFGKVNLRAGLGPEYRSGTETHEGFSDSRKDMKIGVDARVGIGSEVVSEGRWKVIAGADLIGGYHKRAITNDSGFDKVTNEDESWNIGAGPFVNLSFYISPRVSLAAESALYFRHFERTQTELFENFPEFNNQLSKTTGSELKVLLPTSIFLQFHF